MSTPGLKKQGKKIGDVPSVLIAGAVLNLLLMLTALLIASLVVADPMFSTYSSGGGVISFGAWFMYPPVLLVLIPAFITAQLGIKAGQQYVKSSAKNSSYVKSLITICKIGQVMSTIALALIGFILFLVFTFITSWNF